MSGEFRFYFFFIFQRLFYIIRVGHSDPRIRGIRIGTSEFVSYLVLYLLAVLHPVLYRHIYKSAEEKFRRWAQEVWLVQDAEDGIDFLADFIREVGQPTTFSEMGITLDDATIRAIADSTIVTPGCCKQLTPNEIVEILNECK